MKNLSPCFEERSYASLNLKSKTTKGPDNFLALFIYMYKIRKELRESLLLCLLKAFFAKLDGNPNPNFPIKELVFIPSDDLSQKTFDFGSENLLGTYLQTVQISNANVRHEPFIVYN